MIYKINKMLTESISLIHSKDILCVVKKPANSKSCNS